MSHHTQAGRQLTRGSLAVAMVPAMVISGPNSTYGSESI